MATLTAPVMLMILDGFGLGDEKDPTNAVAQAHPEHFLKAWAEYPHTTLTTSGLAVGLPEGQMGNSEVGHLNLGAGRVVYQELTRITKEAEEGKLAVRPVVTEAFAHAKEHALHLVGLLSDGGVHSHINHLKALLKGAKDFGLTKVYVHALLDGRDVPPKSALGYVEELEAYMHEIGVGSIATIGGRYYGMDRDKRWERVELAYEAMASGLGVSAPTAKEAIEQSYEQDVTDEFVLPTVVDREGVISNGDSMIFFNFRPDRARQLVRVFTDPEFMGFERPLFKDLFVAMMTKYEDGLDAKIVYEKEILHDTLGEVLARGGYRQLRIAETEKYAHVTYFFNGGKEDVFPGEDRILVPSPKVATYDLKPEMSAYEVCDHVVKAILSKDYDMIILNFANPDMVGHTGVFEAAKAAIGAVDTCVGRVIDAINEVKGSLLITADHGNSEIMVDPITKAPHTAHTTNPVPLILVSPHTGVTLHEGALCDLAPTMLALAKIPQPEAMTGKSLVDGLK